MALGRWQATIVDTAGNILPGAQVTVRRETAGAPLALLYSDRNGLSGIGNPFTVGSDGLAAFHVTGGAYRITATYGAFTQDWRYVAVGTAAEGDLLPLDISYVFDADTTDSDPGPGRIKFNGSSTQVYIDDFDDLGVDLSAWVARFDDYGISSDRGVLTVRAVDSSAETVFKVTGSITDGGTYSKVTVSSLGTVGTFSASARVTVTFAPRGADGQDGDVSGPGFSVDGQLAAFSGTAGSSIRGATVSEGSPTDPLISGTTAGVHGAVPGHVIEAGHLRTANADVTLTDGATVDTDWELGINFSLTMAGSRTLNVPIHGIPGTWRTIYVAGNDGTQRTITFPAAWAGTPPTLTDITSTKTYLLSIYCRTASQFVVTSVEASP